VEQRNVELLLNREARAGLPLARQLLFYLDPFSLFKDASSGTKRVQELALSYNRAMRWMLVAYLQRWTVMAAIMFAAIAPVEALASQHAFFVIPAAAFAVACCIAITVSAWTLAAYVLLGSKDRR
jgi:hypothetical protein